MKKTKPNLIAAVLVVSESELVLAYPEYSSQLEYNNLNQLNKLLWELGLDSTKPYNRQDGLQHRNRLNQVVTCSRYVGHERLDEEWIKSGYASTEAKDKITGSRILEDIYRVRGLTEDAQLALEAKDKYTKIED